MNWKTILGLLFLHSALCDIQRSEGTQNKFDKGIKVNDPKLDKPKDLSATEVMDKIVNKNPMKLHSINKFSADTGSVKKVPIPDDGFIKINNTNVDINHYDGINVLFDMKADIKKRGIIKFDIIAKKIKDTVKIRSNISQDIDNIVKNYATELDEYFHSISKREIKSKIDWEFYFLHIVESSHKIFSSKTKLLFEAIMIPVSIEFYIDVDFIDLRDDIQNIVDDEKRENLKYVCDNFLICRIYPTYSDKFSELLSKFLQLSEINFVTVTRILNNVIKKKTLFFESIMDAKVLSRISNASLPVRNISQIKEFISSLRNIIAERFILFESKNEKVNAKIKAIKMLIDIVDKTFEKVENHYNNYKLFEVLKSISVWDIQKSVKVTKLLDAYFNEMFNVLNMNLFLETREEMKVLFSFIITGSSKNNALFKELFAEGPKFIKVDNMFRKMNSLANVSF